MIYINDYDFNNLLSLRKTELKPKRNHDGTQVYYYNFPFCFDIETSSFKVNGVKRACMYLWSFSLNGDIIYGRTWNDFTYALNAIKEKLHLNSKRKIIIYVHNLSYEFQFMYSHFKKIENVFARTPRHPIAFDADYCFTFKCSYFLSGLSLAKVADNLTSIKIQKLNGYLDYRQIRHSSTPLTKNELQYSEYDVKILHYFILEEIQKNKNDITKIPLTKTGYVRRYCYEHIKKNTNYIAYRKRIIKSAPLDSDCFSLLYKCFSGGFTHANCIHIMNVIDNVHSIDLTSSYPTQYLRYKYPIAPFTQYIPETREEFFKLIKKLPCIIEIILTNVNNKTSHHILSRNKCSYIENGVFDNGRVAKADKIITYMTSIDFECFNWFYTYDKISIVNMYISSWGFIPKQLIECILKFFNDKTTLKDVIGKEQEYMVSKGMLNAIYGMSVTNPVNDEHLFFNGEWTSEKKQLNTALYENYVKNRKQFLLYQWGVFNTAYARRELYKSVIEFNEDCIYCDTDSNKFLNYEKHKKWIEDYNIKVTQDLEDNIKLMGLDINLLSPKTIKGEIKKLGVWEYEGKYDKFKTLGAKRYMTLKEGKYNITVSGLNKNKAIPYIIEHTNNPFDFFNDEMYIPPEYTGKLTMTYINDEYSAQITDYLGNTEFVHEISYIHSEPQDYSLGIPKEFTDYLADNEYTEFRVQQKLFNKPKELSITPFDYEFRKEDFNE